MMKKILMTGIVAAMMFTISSCDEDTVGIGKTLTSNVDLFTIETDTFDVSSRLSLMMLFYHIVSIPI